VVQLRLGARTIPEETHMGMNYDIWPPTVRPGITFDADLEPQTLRGVDIEASGKLFFVDLHGNADSRTFTSVSVPNRFVMQIKKIVGNGSGAIGDGVTGTDIPLVSIKGLL
jgi:hypothetical protein